MPKLFLTSSSADSRVIRALSLRPSRCWSDASRRALEQAAEEGHCFLPRERLVQVASALLAVDAAAVEIAVTMLESTQQVVDHMRRLQRDARDYQGWAIPCHLPDFADFTCLRYPVYLPILEELAASKKGDERALLGIAHIPTPEATKVLVRLLAHPNKDFSLKAACALSDRLPEPPTTERQRRKNPLELMDADPQLVKKSWRDDAAPPFRRFARGMLSDTELTSLRGAAFVLESIARADLGYGNAIRNALEKLRLVRRRAQRPTVNSVGQLLDALKLSASSQSDFGNAYVTLMTDERSLAAGHGEQIFVKLELAQILRVVEIEARRLGTAGADRDAPADDAAGARPPRAAPRAGRTVRGHPSPGARHAPHARHARPHAAAKAVPEAATSIVCETSAKKFRFDPVKRKIRRAERGETSLILD